MIADVITNAEKKMINSVKAFQSELGTLRTGHASPALLEHIKADYAGVPTPLNQLATISAPEARLLVIRPWDRSSVVGIEKAIMKSDLGLNPSTDGSVIRIAIPPLSEERRQEMIKIVRKWAEERRVVIRSVRHEAINELKKMEKDKEISQDEQKRAQDQLQKVTDAQIADVDNITREKEKELMEV
ncbi:MAG: ribosome recycling factor [Chloroflexota bacterium]